MRAVGRISGIFAWVCPFRCAPIVDSRIVGFVFNGGRISVSVQLFCISRQAVAQQRESQQKRYETAEGILRRSATGNARGSGAIVSICRFLSEFRQRMRPVERIAKDKPNRNSDANHACGYHPQAHNISDSDGPHERHEPLPR
ncbi:hypothetical protein VJ923_02150 [Adlercreutzia sp. R25]|uniref:Uncharacterized protein n=1 Tax=Adlercreutzia shanghongiae TaxID=3111773 RepID=A0ABU6IVV7_9ACTN|nr:MULTISPECIES: hypothetical protein [unclassified Adlercreutzia]MEC4271963.1 hypothetical protein [Adlercreutzia sp. R25]MEC4293694.1 hypothetical protein [Adlercreutzia sp. R22]